MVLLPKCCCGTCEQCTGPQCCGTDWPAAEGVCCDDEWHSEAGQCCGDEWHAATESGVCCGYNIFDNYALLDASASFYDAAAEQNLQYAQAFYLYRPLDHLSYVRLKLWRNPDSTGTFSVYIYDSTIDGKPNAAVATVAEDVDFSELGTDETAHWKKLDIDLGTTLTPDVPYSIYWLVVIADSGHQDLFWRQNPIGWGHKFGSNNWDSSGIGLAARFGTDKWHPTETDPGKCCDDIWHPEDTEPGECCLDVWFPNAETPGQCCGDEWRVEGEECETGQVFFVIVEEFPTLGTSETVCCACIAQEVVDANEGPDDVTWCCNTVDGAYQSQDGQCKQRCCIDHECTMEYPADCTGESLEGHCNRGCPAGCCTESSDGDVTCQTIDSGLCLAPSVVDTAGCETGCLGECCIAGVSQGQTTQAACAELGGVWGGLGSTVCVDLNECRTPFTASCCESKASVAAGLTFTQPRNKRTPPFEGTLRVTVTGTTDSPVLVHGTPFGVEEDPPKRCPINHTFLLCWDKFNIEPVPCGTNFRNLDVTVCWDEHPHEAETLDFSGCNDITVWLGQCDRNCVTTLAYADTGHTSNASVVMLGDAFIEANGTGALVLTTAVTHIGSCNRKLTLTGTSTAENEIGDIPDPSGGTLSLDKIGIGVWKLSGESSYSGQLRVISGTVIVGADVPDTGNSPWGTATSTAFRPVVFSDAKMLLAGGVTVSRGFSIGGNNAVIGGYDSGSSTIAGTFSIRLGGNVIFQAAAGGDVTIAPQTWLDGDGNYDPAVSVTVGSAGNDGTVILDSTLPDSITAVDVVAGTLRLISTDDRIGTTTPVTIGDGTLELDGVDQTSPSVSVEGDATISVSTGKALTVDGALTGTAGSLVKTGAGTLNLDGGTTFTGGIEIDAGTLNVTGIVSGPNKVSASAFTATTLTVAFTAEPDSADEYVLLAGPTTSWSGSVTLTGTSKTGTYDAATSTLTID